MSEEEVEPKTYRQVVNCDDKCGAFEFPETIDEYRWTLEHYKHHKFLDGCAHGH